MRLADRRRARSAAPAPERIAVSPRPRGSSLGSSSSAWTRTAQSLSLERLLERARRLRRAVGRERRRGPPCAPHTPSRPAPSCTPRAAPRRRPAGLSSPSSRAAVARTTKSGSASRSTRTVRRSRAFRRASDVSTAGIDALVLVLEHRAQPVGRELGGQVAEHVGERGADAPVPIGVHARRARRGSSPGSIAAAARSAAARIAGQSSVSRSWTVGSAVRRLQRAERRHRFEPEVRMRRWRRRRGATSGATASGAPICAERADRRRPSSSRPRLRRRIDERERAA